MKKVVEAAAVENEDAVVGGGIRITSGYALGANPDRLDPTYPPVAAEVCENLCRFVTLTKWLAVDVRQLEDPAA